MLNIDKTVKADLSVSKRVYFLVLILSFVWLFSIIAAPILMNLGGVFKIPAEFLYLFFSKTCHQYESRSFLLYDYSFAVCSRCFTIYTGFFAGIIFYPFKYRLNNISVPSLYILCLFLIPLVSDVMLERAGILANTFLTRSVTGFFAGFILPFYLIPGFIRFFNEVIIFLRNRTVKLN